MNDGGEDRKPDEAANEQDLVNGIGAAHPLDECIAARGDADRKECAEDCQGLVVGMESRCHADAHISVQGAYKCEGRMARRTGRRTKLRYLDEMILTRLLATVLMLVA